MKQLLFEIENCQGLENALMSIRSAIAFRSSSAVLLHVYCNDSSNLNGLPNAAFVSQVVERIRSTLPESQLIGLSCGGGICGENISECPVLLSVILFQSSWVKVLSYRDVASRENEVGERLFDEVNRHPDVKGVELFFADSTIDSAPIYESLQRCPTGLPFFGGYAVEHDTAREPAFLITDQGILRDSVAAVLYGGAELNVNAGRTTGWKPLGSTFRVTSAQGRRLFSVNGIPAYDLYDRFLKLPENIPLRECAREFPLMLLKGKMKLLRHPQKKFDDSSLLLDGRVREGDEICLSYGAPLEIIRKMNARCEKIRSFEPEAILLFSCLGRKSYWGNLIDWEIKPFKALAQTQGACLDGQVMRNNQTGRVLEHRLTLLSIAMREGEKTGRSMPEIEIDDDVLKDKMSLVHRMSNLIESTMEELQKANETLTIMNERLARANDELHHIAITDELTGLYNRREIERRIKAALEHAKTDDKTIALVMLDIDFFKKVNDTYGHDVGDIVLKDVSAILQEYTDESLGQASGRWGGEEFFVLLPNKNLNEALEAAERIREAVERHSFPEAKHLTVSIGVTCADADSNYQAIFIRADDALYQAKQGGRNQVVGL